MGVLWVALCVRWDSGIFFVALLFSGCGGFRPLDLEAFIDSIFVAGLH